MAEFSVTDYIIKMGHSNHSETIDLINLLLKLLHQDVSLAPLKILF